MQRIPKNIQDALANGYKYQGDTCEETIMPDRILQRGKWELANDDLDQIEIPFTATIRFGKPKPVSDRTPALTAKK